MWGQSYLTIQTNSDIFEQDIDFQKKSKKILQVFNIYIFNQTPANCLCISLKFVVSSRCTNEQCCPAKL